MIWPRVFSLESFKEVFKNDQLVRAYGITIARTVIGTALHVLCTGMLAYAITKKNLMLRNVYLILFVITMFFGGGLIATTINMRNLGFVNNFLVYVIPGAYSVMNMLIMKSFFRSIPSSLEEAARLDGANDFVIFFRVILPNSKPVVATIALMTAVGQWNSWMDAYIFCPDKNLWPVQYILQRVVLGAQGATAFSQYLSSSGAGGGGMAVTPFSVQCATLVVAIGPIILIYPFFQKYFNKGFMIGSIKE